MKTKLLTLLLGAILLAGCSSKNEGLNTPLALPNQDLKNYPTPSLKISTLTQENLKRDYLIKFFSPWEKKPKETRFTTLWSINESLANPGFSENYLPHTTNFILSLKKEMDFDNFPSLAIPAIITQSTNLRVLPTNKPRFANPQKAGEGFPFDYWQNSSIYSGTPILITHYSQSKAWAFVESGFVSGWVEVSKIATFSQEQVQITRSRNFIVPTQDYVPLYDSRSQFLENARIGMLLPIVEQNKNAYKTLIYQRDEKGQAKAITTWVSKEYFQTFPMIFSTRNFATLAQKLIGEKYGWGGILGNRDCSMFLRDIFSNYGIYLPRNSQAQIQYETPNKLSTYYDLSSLDSAQKLEKIAQNAIPFATLIAMKGHIMLYVGQFGNKIMVLHDIWGLKTLQNETLEGRKIIGQIAITPIDIGEDIPDISQDSLLYKRVYGMRNLFSKDAFKNE
ncbi:MAG: SH3 domain-containing protein [Helicobacter sp.]|nr:SH3 domain-containing protein [Helicobacter sp.]